MSELYDVIIIGGGAGGMSAGVYAARGKMKTLIIEEKRKAGGQAATTDEMENYPGILSATGPELMDAFRAHCDKFGVEFTKGIVNKIDVADDGYLKTLTTNKGEVFQAKSIIIATGASPLILGVRAKMNSAVKAYRIAQPVMLISSKNWILWLLVQVIPLLKNPFSSLSLLIKLP